MASCGGGGGTSTTAELTPEEVSANLQSAGYRVGKPIHSGANEGVAQNGKLDADTYLSVDADPSGVQLYAGIYFFSNEKDAGIAAAEFAKEGDSSSTSTLEGTRLYNVSGTKAQLDGIVAAAETG